MAVTIALVAASAIATPTAIAPNRATAAAKLVAAAGDIACHPGSDAFNDGLGTASECRQMHTSNLLVGRGYDAVLPLGDTQYRFGEHANYLASYDPSWGRVKSISRPVPGNHEYETPGARGYFNYFNGVGNGGGRAGHRRRGYYKFDLGSWRLIALNSNCPAVACGRSSRQLRWLRSVLRRSRARCTLAYAHHPRFSSGRRGNTRAIRALYRALVAAGVDLLLSGNDHHYERFAPKRQRGRVDRRRGVRQFVVGTGGQRLIPLPARRALGSRRAIDSAFGILHLRLGHAGYRWRFISEAGQALDRGRGRCRPRARRSNR